MSNPIPNISEVDYLAVQEATRQATPSLHSNSSWLHIGSHSRIDTLLTSEPASQISATAHSKPTDHESANRLPDGPQATWQYLMRRVSALPGLQKSDEAETLDTAMTNEFIDEEMLRQQLEDMANNDEDNLPSLEECAKVQDSGTEKSETQPNYFTNPFESDNEYRPDSMETPISLHPSIRLPAQSNDSSVFLSDKYHTPLSMPVALSQGGENEKSKTDTEQQQQNTIDLNALANDMPMPHLRKTNSEVQGNICEIFETCFF
jgi:hypothetical protein